MKTGLNVNNMTFFRDKNSKATPLILEGIAFMTVYYLYYPFIQMFGKRMGANDLHIALLNSIPSLVAIFVLIPCGIIIERINRKKQTVMCLIFINSIFYALIAFVPFIGHRAKVILYVILIGLMNCPNSLYLVTWKSYFADNFTGAYGNSLYAARSKYSTFFGLITVLVTGFILTNIPKSDEERLVVYQIFYGICFILTLVQLLLFSQVRGHQVTESVFRADTAAVLKSSFIKKEIANMLSNRLFLTFCLCGFVSHFAWQMCWPLVFYYNADHAMLNEFQLSLTSVTEGFAEFLSFSFWNRMIEKKGSNRTLVITAAALALNPLFFTALWSFPVILLINMIMGISASGFNLTIFTTLLETLPAEKKTAYISTFNTITSITGFIAPLAGAWIYSKTSIYQAFVIVSVLRMIAAILYIVRLRKVVHGQSGV